MKFLFLLFITFSLLQAETNYPRIGNYFLDANVTSLDIDSLSKCDFVVFDHMVSRMSPELLDTIHARNPECKIIAYVVSQEINLGHASWEGSLNASMLKEIQPEWWLKNSKGEAITFWPGTEMLNIGAGQPEVSSIKWNRYLASIVTDSILSDERWDGVYLDNCWNSVHWVDTLMDINRDGEPDEQWFADSLWESGMNLMLDLIREENPSKLVVGNGGYRYKKQLNGALFEDFPTWGSWWRLMDIYLDFDSTSYGTPFNLINSTTANSGDVSLQWMRYGLTSTLMGDGYFSYDFGADDHSQNWWFDEYDAELGAPLGSALFHNERVTASIDFENGFGNWSSGDWKMSTSIKNDAQWGSSVFEADVSGEEQWNQILRSDELIISEGSHLKFEFDLRVDAADSGANIFVILRKGDDYDSDVSLGNLKINSSIDTTISFYSDSSTVGSGYSLMIGVEQGAKVTLDNLTFSSNEDLYVTREFENGMVVINPSPRTQTISFPGYRKIVGTQDSNHNSGEDASSLNLNSRDGIILLKGTTPIVQHDISSSSVSIQSRNGAVSFDLSDITEPVKMIVSSPSGRIVFSKEITDHFLLSTENLATGAYIVKLLRNRSVIHQDKILLY